jgi:hypothetical protein
MIYLLTLFGLSPGGSSTVHIYTQTIHRTNTNNNRTTQITTNLEECGPCPVFARFFLAFALQLRKKHGKTLVKVRKTSVKVRNTSAKLSLQTKRTSMYFFRIILPMLKKVIRYNTGNNFQFKHAIWRL